ncbi:MAG: quinone oxidoreductase family protein [Micromonosporaceae bacterium]
MRAVVVDRHGGPEVLSIAERPDPRPGATDVLVDVEAAGVNFIDTYHRSGYYPTTPPFVPGVEGVGVVREVGAEIASAVSPGDRVGWVMVSGSYAERMVVPYERLVPVPEQVDPQVAAASLLQGVTAHYLTNDTYRVRPGDTVLVHAAAGGMGLVLTQLVKLRGGRVIGTVSTAEKEKLAREAGADEVIRYDDVPAQVRELTDGEGVAVVYDGVGRATFGGSLASLRRRGMLAQYGQASGPVPPFDLKQLADGGSLFLTRPSLGHHIADRDELVHRTSAILGMVAKGDLHIHIGARYPLAEAATAHQDLEGRRTTGKVLLLPPRSGQHTVG